MATQIKPLRIDDLPEGKNAFSKAWFGFFETVARRLSGAGSLEQISTIDAVDAATTQALANETKAKLNALIAELGK